MELLQGRHAVGHMVLEFWEAEAKRHHGDAAVARAARDIRLLVDLLNSEVAQKAVLLEYAHRHVQSWAEAGRDSSTQPGWKVINEA